MPRAASNRARRAQGVESVGLVATVTLPLPPEGDGVSSRDTVDLFDRGFARRVTPGIVRAGLQPCDALTCQDNIPGTPASDDKLSNARPACCQAPVDIDEPLYALSKLFEAGETGPGGHAHHHAAHTACSAERWMAAGTAAAALVGMWYGARNIAAARQTGGVLTRMRQRVERRRQEAPARTPGPRPLPERQALRNDEAHILRLEHAAATHTFSKRHGALQVLNGGLLLASVAAPVLAPLATLGMVAFCGWQAGRYALARRELGRGRPLAPAEKAARAGLRVFDAQRAAHKKAFLHGAAAHGTYAAGAALLTVATTAAAAAPLLWPGLALLALGMVGVAVTGKRCADATFTSNSFADLGGQALGSKAAMLRQIALLDGEGRLAASAAAGVPRADGRLKRFWRGFVMLVGTWIGLEKRAVTRVHRMRVATFRPRSAAWFGDFVQQAGHRRKAVLAEEIADLARKQHAAKHPGDVEALVGTQRLLEQWVGMEDAWADTCRNRVNDAPAMAEMTLSWLISRQWHEEVISSLCLALPTRDLQEQPWWVCGDKTEPRLNAPVWLAALKRGDARAEALWNLLQPVLADFMAHRQPEVTRHRVDAMVNQLAARGRRRAANARAAG